ncbi:hypothetical protein FIU87_00735 [Bacillus sp. THAF10]|nr:hypothetical protein FIU87_00735 [Bacillus sp. THAF10]
MQPGVERFIRFIFFQQEKWGVFVFWCGGGQGMLGRWDGVAGWCGLEIRILVGGVGLCTDIRLDVLGVSRISMWFFVG